MSNPTHVEQPQTATVPTPAARTHAMLLIRTVYICIWRGENNLPNDPWIRLAGFSGKVHQHQEISQLKMIHVHPSPPTPDSLDIEKFRSD